ncbi:hypothetical protein [Nocardia suismassiliense]|uniref:hypothetical protein n=1 Tax=Nocardia suismassiliense TaxID=2077092 RepID=UPI000D1E7774|nr:hypothetical protein [Nocardia suismassiliense]
MSHPPAEQPTTGSAFDGFTQVAKSVGQVVAPTTLLTALLFFFGWHHVYRFFYYFGVDSTTLDPSIREYLMRTVDALFVPLIVVGLLCMAVLWGYTALPNSVRERRPAWWITAVIAVLAVAVLLNGVSRVFVVTALNDGLCVAPVSIIIAVLVLWALIVQRRNRLRAQLPETAPLPRSQAAAVTEWAILFAVIGINLFWIAADYSIAVAQSRASEWAAQLPTSSQVVIYSEKDLHLSHSDVQKARCDTDPTAGSAYRFRYDGLVPLTRIGDHYVLVPRTWTPGNGAAIVLPASPPGAIRFEFRLAGDSPSPTC